MQDLVVCSIGCHALEMAEIVERINRVSATWNLLGFFSEKNAYEKHQGLTLNGCRVLGTIEHLEKYLMPRWPSATDSKTPFRWSAPPR